MGIHKGNNIKGKECCQENALGKKLRKIIQVHKKEPLNYEVKTNAEKIPEESRSILTAFHSLVIEARKKKIK